MKKKQSVRVFADANVLFSAAYRVEAPLARLWTIPRVHVVTSSYAVVEAWRNLSDISQRNRLDQLIAQTEVIESVGDVSLPPGIDLPAKDRPILQAAIAARAEYLVTGDRMHFGQYYESTIEGVMILSSAMLFARLYFTV